MANRDSVPSNKGLAADRSRLLDAGVTELQDPSMRIRDLKVKNLADMASCSLGAFFNIWPDRAAYCTNLAAHITSPDFDSNLDVANRLAREADADGFDSRYVWAANLLAVVAVQKMLTPRVGLHHNFDTVPTAKSNLAEYYTRNGVRVQDSLFETFDVTVTDTGSLAIILTCEAVALGAARDMLDVDTATDVIARQIPA